MEWKLAGLVDYAISSLKDCGGRAYCSGPGPDVFREDYVQRIEHSEFSSLSFRYRPKRRVCCDLVVFSNSFRSQLVRVPMKLICVKSDQSENWHDDSSMPTNHRQYKSQ